MDSIGTVVDILDWLDTDRPMLRNLTFYLTGSLTGFAISLHFRSVSLDHQVGSLLITGEQAVSQSPDSLDINKRLQVTPSSQW